MKRLYYLFRGAHHARAISDDLQKAGIDDSHLHFMSHSPGPLQLAHVTTTDIFEETDIQHRGIHGGIIGLAVGILFSLYLLTTELGEHINTLVFFVVSLFIALFGTWVGGFVGLQSDNHHIARFHDALERGETLVMVDTFTPQQEQQARKIMDTRHLEARFEGEDIKYREFA